MGDASMSAFHRMVRAMSWRKSQPPDGVWLEVLDPEGILHKARACYQERPYWEDIHGKVYEADHFLAWRYKEADEPIVIDRALLTPPRGKR